MKTIRMGALLAALVLGGCTLQPLKSGELPQTTAATKRGPTYSYRPLDPLDAKLENNGVEVTNCRILELLPDETMRLAIGQVDVSGNVSYGVAKVGGASQHYMVVLDYIKATTFSVAKPPSEGGSADVGFVPTYVGVGLRLTADLHILQGSVDLANLIAIGAAAQEKRVTGSLVVQTLGISGQNISLSITTDISTASIQNALVTLGTIKSKIYDPQTEITPRVVGTYDVFGPDRKAFDDYFVAIMRKPPTLTQRIHSPRCK